MTKKTTPEVSEDVLPEFLTMKTFIASVMADIDIFLLQNEEQTADNDQETFTREDIRTQLRKSMDKSLGLLEFNGFDINEAMKFRQDSLTFITGKTRHYP